MSGWEVAGAIVACWIVVSIAVGLVVAQLLRDAEAPDYKLDPPASFADAEYRERVHQYRMEAHR